MFDRLVWQSDRATLNGITFLLFGEANQEEPTSPDQFLLAKDKLIIEEYDRFFEDFPPTGIRNFLELGIYRGGSAILWTEVLHPEKYVAIDYADREDSPVFAEYVSKRHLGDRLRTYWRTDQADAARLLDIVDRDFDGPLDLVIDDASHLYAPTKKSFQALFPRLREGGFYLIEDWPWQLDANYRAQFPPTEPGLLSLVPDLGLLLIRAPQIIARLEIRRSFLVIQRGPLGEAEARTNLEALWGSQ